jgi:hypothetical protein
MQINPEMRNCIVNCLHCYGVCTELAMNHSLELGGRHVEPEHFRLMINCADICRTAADFMLSGSPLHPQVCEVCAQVCEACGMSCEDLSDMQACVSACRACAESCLKLLQPSGSASSGSLISAPLR